MKLLNVVLFKTNWAACVLGGTIWGLAGVAMLLTYSYYAGTLKRDVPLLVGLVCIGSVLDSAWIMLGILDYGTALAPLWILLLWAGLAMTLNHSMAVFRSYPVIGAIMAAGAAPVTYLTGESLGAVTVANVEGLALVALSWGILFFIVFKFPPIGRKLEASPGTS